LLTLLMSSVLPTSAIVRLFLGLLVQMRTVSFNEGSKHEKFKICICSVAVESRLQGIQDGRCSL
jgi:hypothetical protein